MEGGRLAAARSAAIALAVGLAALAGCSADGHATTGRATSQPTAAPAPGRTAAGQAFGGSVLVGLPRHASQGQSNLLGVACTSSGECTAGGDYTDTGGGTQAMVVTLAHGRWGRATEVRLPADASVVQHARINAVTCPGRGDCVAVGLYSTARGAHRFAVTEQHGTWRRAVPMGSPANDDLKAADPESVACPSAGYCLAVGNYRAGPDTDGMAITETAGRWGAPQELRMPPDTEANPDAYITGVACSGVGDCVATGWYDSLTTQALSAFAAVEVSGTWQRGDDVEPPPASQGHGARLAAVTCWAGGGCLAAGSYQTVSYAEAFAVTESAGPVERAGLDDADPGERPWGQRLSHWLRERAPLLATARYGLVLPGAGVIPTVPAGSPVLLVLTWSLGHRSAGHWALTAGVRQPAGAGGGGPEMAAVGCAADGYCAAVGSYVTGAGTARAMVATTR